MKHFFTCIAWLFAATANPQSLRFNGSSQCLSLGNHNALKLSAFTLEAWVRPEGAGVPTNSGQGGITVYPIIAKGRGEADKPASLNVNYMLGMDAANRLCADFEEASGRNHPVRSKAVLAANTWTHVATTYDPASAIWRLYINGLPDTVRDVGTNIYPANMGNQPASVASTFDSKSVAQGFFKGRIDEVRVWNVVRTATAIRDNYKLQLTAGSGLVARYGLNEGSGNVANNSSANGNGALLNNPLWSNDFNNSAPAKPATPSPATGSNVDATLVQLKVTVNDANKDKLRVRFYGRKKVTKEKFTIIMLPDTQFYTAERQGKNGGNNALFKSQTDWIARNRASKNIVYVGQLGDCVENGDRYEVEWKRADTAMRTIENESKTGLADGLPYGICVGNHDQSPFGDPNGTTALYNRYFGSGRFAGRPYYGGHSGDNNDNHYQTFSAGGLDFLVICPEYDQSKAFSAAGGTLDWIEGLVKAHPTHKVMVLSHYVLKINGTFTAQGAAIYNRLKSYPGFILMSGGHETGGDGEARRTDVVNGRVIHTITSDYQTRTNGGNGLLRIYEFDPVNNSIRAQTYSPYTNSYETDANSSFVLQTDLSTSAKPYTLLGEVSGLNPTATASITWEVAQNEAYEWYATVWDGEKTTTGLVWPFTTNFTAVAPGSDAHNKLLVPEGDNKVQDKLFAIYPNPATGGKIAIALLQKDTDPVVVELYDMSGTVRHRQTYGTNISIISLNHQLSPGIYTVVVRVDNRKQVQKVVVRR